MANIRTKADIRAEERAIARRDHRHCAGELFGYTSRNPEPAVRGDVKRCQHGHIMEFLDRGFGINARILSPKTHPILYMRAKRLLAEEEKMRQEERDSDGGS